MQQRFTSAEGGKDLSEDAHEGTLGAKGGHMQAHKNWTDSRAVASAARWAAVVVVVCGCLGLAVGLERAVRADRVTEGVAFVIASTMAAAVSLVVLLFVAWRVNPPEADAPVDGEDRPRQ